MLTRRAFLATTAGSAFCRTAPLALAFAPTAARAEVVTIVIAIAAAVAGMIAAHNRGGSPIGDYLNALNAKLNVTIEQLVSLQDAVSSVLVKLAKLTSEIDALLRENEVKNLHDVTYAAVISYTKLFRVRENYKTDQEFVNAPGVALDVRSALDSLERATALLKQKKAFGPTTAMIIPSAFLLEHSLLLLRGDRPRDIAARLEASLSWLDQVADPLISTSTATYRAQAVLRHQQYKKAFQDNALGKQFTNFLGVALFECVGVHDYIAEHWEPVRCSEPPPSGLNFEEPSLPERSPSPIPIQLWKVAVGSCSRKVPAHHGLTQSRFQNMILTEKPYNAPVIVEGKETEKPAGFLALYLDKQPMSEALPPDSKSLPPICPIHNVDAPTPQNRANWIENTINNSKKQTDYKQLETLIDQMNFERARIALATAALTIAAKGRSELQFLIRDLKG